MDRRPRPKRKAESQDNERLSKRLGLLNLEKNGHRLYVPVESPAADGSGSGPGPVPPSTAAATVARTAMTPAPPVPADDSMQLDDTKYKVYIYNLDDELSSSESEHEDGRLLLLPDIHKHLRANRIPPVVLPNSDGELAGMQLVLYNKAPSSLTVPAEQDSVRKAIIDARARFREKQREEREAMDVAADAGPRLDDTSPGFRAADEDDDSDAMDLS